jgi:glycine cleavage system H protein
VRNFNNVGHDSKAKQNSGGFTGVRPPENSLDNLLSLRKSPAQNFMSSKVPPDLKYAKSHEWVRVSNGVATVGITDHAQHELTDVVFVELPAVGRKVKAGEACAVVESVKTASDIYSPVSGEVVAVNQKAADSPALVNDQPYGDGWMFQVKLSDANELALLLSPADYSAQTGG